MLGPINFSKRFLFLLLLIVTATISIASTESSEPNRNPRLAKRAGLKPTCSLPNSWSGIWSNQQTNKELQFVINSINEASAGGSGSAKFKSNNERLVENAKQLYKTIDEYKFLNRGSCVNNKDERYFFYDDSGKCFRCLFIIQRHVNVLQYRETHCDEEISDFDELCGMLTPDQPLITVVREDAIAEKCPFVDSYHAFDSKSSSSSSPSQRSPSQNENHYSNTADAVVPLMASSSSVKSPFHKESGKLGCFKQPDSNVITKCADHTMLRLDFQDCINLQHKSLNAAKSESGGVDSHKNHQHRNHVVKKLKKSDKNEKPPKDEENGIIANCIAHWSEGYWHYLIVKQSRSASKLAHKNQQKTANGKQSGQEANGYKCLVYKDVDKLLRNGAGSSKSNPSSNVIQLSMSDDEMCRDFYVSPDGLNSFTLEKYKSPHNRNSRFMAKKNSSKIVEFNQNFYHSHRWSHQFYQNRYQQHQNHHNNPNSFCKFPKFLNKKWKNLQQSKYAISLRKNLLQIVTLSSVNRRLEDTVNTTTASSSSSSSINNVDKSTGSNDREYKSETVYLKLSCVESIKPYSENTRLLRKSSIRKYSLNQPSAKDSPSTSTPGQDSHSSELEFNAKEKLDYLFLVNNQLDCTSTLKCLQISPKSEFIIHMRYGNFDGTKCDFGKHNLIYEDYLYIETDQGINCPFSNRIYQLSVDKTAAPLPSPPTPSRENSKSGVFQKRSPAESPREESRRSSTSLFTSLFDLFSASVDSKDCEHYLKIGCNNRFYNDYSIYKKCSLASSMRGNELGSSGGGGVDGVDGAKFHLADEEKVKNLKKDFKYSMRSLPNGVSSDSSATRNDAAAPTGEQQLPLEPIKEEYEANRICLAFWRKNSKHDNSEYDQTNDEYNVNEEDYGYSDYNAADYNDDSVYNQNKKSTDEGSSPSSSDSDPIETSFVVLSKLPNSDTFSITCSIWESFKKSKKLRISYTDLNSCTNIESNDETAPESGEDGDLEATLRPSEANDNTNERQLYRQTNSQNSFVLVANDAQDGKSKSANNGAEYPLDQQHYSAQSERLVVSSVGDSFVERPSLENRRAAVAENTAIFDFAGTCSSYKETNGAGRQLAISLSIKLLALTSLVFTVYRQL